MAKLGICQSISVLDLHTHVPIRYESDSYSQSGQQELKKNLIYDCCTSRFEGLVNEKHKCVIFRKKLRQENEMNNHIGPELGMGDLSTVVGRKKKNLSVHTASSKNS